MNTELIVPFNKGGMKHGFSGTILLLIFFVYLFYVSTGWQNIVGYYAYICIRIFLNFIIACLVFAAVFGYYLVKSPEPALILNKNGIWIKYYNFIPWENIQEVARYCLPTTPIEALGIKGSLGCIKKCFMGGQKYTFFGRASLVITIK